ncbi:hypothetical protein Q1695_004646 [Nippostrongylus brasiliensis]|nr:hypothetical protein Q1695_004646 [Nippostrongylus brasiliensis]
MSKRASVAFLEMDSDSDEDRLVIVDDEGELSEITRESSINAMNEINNHDCTITAEQEPTSLQQQRSRLPASLKERIVRSNARLPKPDVVMLRRVPPKHGKFAKKRIKMEVEDDESSSVGEGNTQIHGCVHDDNRRANRVIKQEIVEEDSCEGGDLSQNEGGPVEWKRVSLPARTYQEKRKAVLDAVMGLKNPHPTIVIKQEPIDEDERNIETVTLDSDEEIADINGNYLSERGTKITSSAVGKEQVCVPNKLREESASTGPATSSNPICGRYRAFKHPRLKEGDRVVQLLEWNEASTLPVGSKAKKRCRKSRQATTNLDSNIERESKSKRLKCSRPIKEEPKESVDQISQNEATSGSVPMEAPQSEADFLKLICSELGIDEKRVKKPRKQKAKKEREIPSGLDVCEKDVDNVIYPEENAPEAPLSEEVVVLENDEEQHRPCVEVLNGNNSCSDDIIVEGEVLRLSRARRRKLTRSLLKECNSLPQKTSRHRSSQCASIRRRMMRMHAHVEMLANDEESFDTLAKYPFEIAYPSTADGFCSPPDENMMYFFEDYMTNVLGKGAPVDDLENRLKEKIECLQMELKELEITKAQLEREDNLGTQPFFDDYAYRRHPLRTRHQSKQLYGVHPAQLTKTSCALSDSAAMWIVKRVGRLTLFRKKGEFDEFSARLDAITGVREEPETDPQYLNFIQTMINNRRLQSTRVQRRTAQVDSNLGMNSHDHHPSEEQSFGVGDYGLVL